MTLLSGLWVPATSNFPLQRSGALVMLADRLFLHHRARIVEFTARHRLPAVYAYNELVQVGG
jgi:hypothetical protein